MNPLIRAQLIGPPPPRPPQAGQVQQPTQPVGQPQSQPAVQPSAPAQPAVQQQPPTFGSGIGQALVATDTPPSAPPPPPPTVAQSTPWLQPWQMAPQQAVATPAPPSNTPPPPSYTPPPAGVGGATGGVSAPVHYIGNTGQTMSQEEYDKVIASGGHYTPPESALGPVNPAFVDSPSQPPVEVSRQPSPTTPPPEGANVADPNDPNTWGAGFYTPDGRLIPEGASFDPGSNMIVPRGGVRTWQFDLKHNPNLPTTLGWMERWENRDPALDGVPDLNTPWGADNYYFQVNGGPQDPAAGLGTYGPGPDTRGYIRTEQDMFGEDDEYQQELLDLLSGQIQSGLGTTQWNPADPFGGSAFDTGHAPPMTPPPLEVGEPEDEFDDSIEDSVFDTGHALPPSWTLPSVGSIQPGPPDSGQGGYGGTDPQEPDYVESGGAPPIAPPVDSRGDVEEDEEDGDYGIDRPESDFDFETPDPMDIFNQSADAVRDRIARSREQGQRRVEEIASERGVVGGSPELGMLADLETELGLQAREEFGALGREQQQFALQNRAQELQKELHDSSLAFEYAALEQDSRFRDAALQLQESGMNKDDAYRYAAMNMDARFRQIAADLQSRGLDIEESMRQAELQWSKERFGTEVGLQQQGLGLEQDRFRAWIQQMLYDQGIEAQDVPPWLQDLMEGTPGSRTSPINIQPPPGMTPEQKAVWDAMIGVMNGTRGR